MSMADLRILVSLYLSGELSAAQLEANLHPDDIAPELGWTPQYFCTLMRCNATDDRKRDICRGWLDNGWTQHCEMKDGVPHMFVISGTGERLEHGAKLGDTEIS